MLKLVNIPGFDEVGEAPSNEALNKRGRGGEEKLEGQEITKGGPGEKPDRPFMATGRSRERAN